MEKISLKPLSQELIFKIPESGVFFDVISSLPTQEQEKQLGNLYVIGHIKSDQEDMGYLVSLISSLAKREYYSETTKNLDSPKAAFEHTLKKLNEVLEEFFQNKKFNLNVGLMVVAGDSIFLSRLGKFKVLLGRSNEIIDIFNNINLFQKDHIEEKEFSNIISGNTKPNDAIFAFFPSRSLSAREKQIKKMKDSSKNFSCCGIHLEIKRTANAIQIIPDKTEKKPTSQNLSIKSPEQRSAIPEVVPDSVIQNLEERADKSAGSSEQPHETFVLRDVTLGRRDGFFKKTLNYALKFQPWRIISKPAKIGMAVAFLGLIFTSVFILKTFLPNKESKELRTAIQQVKIDLKLAQTHLTQNEIIKARQLVSASLISVSSFQPNENISQLTASLNEILDKIDLVKESSLSLLSDLSQIFLNKEKIDEVLSNNGHFYALTSIGSIAEISGNNSNNLKVIDGIDIKSARIFSNNNKLAIFNGSNLLISFDIESKKITQYLLKNSVNALASELYQENLYILDGTSIFKYPDAAKGNSERQPWLGEPLRENSVLMAVDGKIYILSSNGILTTYFKGKKEKETQLPISVSPGSGFVTKKDFPYLIYIDVLLKRVMIFSKESGILNATFKVNDIGDILSWNLDQQNNFLYLLSSDQKIWKLEIK